MFVRVCVHSTSSPTDPVPPATPVVVEVSWGAEWITETTTRFDCTSTDCSPTSGSAVRNAATSAMFSMNPRSTSAWVMTT